MYVSLHLSLSLSPPPDNKWKKNVEINKRYKVKYRKLMGSGRGRIWSEGFPAVKGLGYELEGP